MDLDFGFICDYVDLSGPKLHALGIGFESFHAANVPARPAPFFFVAQIRASVAEVGPKEASVKLIDEDGRTLIDMPLALTIAAQAPGQEPVARIVVRFENVEFPSFGAYALHLVVSGHELCRVPFRVVRSPSAA